MVRSDASPVLGAGQSSLSHPPTHAKFSESASATCGRTPRSTSRVCLSSGLVPGGLEFRGGAGSALPGRGQEDPVRVVPQRKAGTKTKMKRVALNTAW